MTSLLATSLRTRLIGSYLVIAVVAVALVALFIRQSNLMELRRAAFERERSFLAASLTDLYRRDRSWVNVRQHVDGLLGVRNPGRPEQGGPPVADPDKLGPPSTFGLPAIADADDVVILPVSDLPRGTVVPPDVLAESGTTILVDGVKVGTILLLPIRDRIGPEEQIYVDRTNRALWLGSFGGVLVALMIGLFLADKITHPVSTLTAAAQRMRQGDLEQRVPVRSGDEIGQLALAFNQMSQEIALQLKLRRQMTADIAHDLRTPLTTIAGYVEAMRDGDLAPTTERLSLVFGEIQHLQHLVADLRLLSQADAGELRLNLAPVQPSALIERAAAAHRRQAEQRGVDLRVDACPTEPYVEVDEARIARVFDNLVDNAVQHTPSGGQIVLSAVQTASGVVFRVRDSGDGISPEDLPHVFDRFYRADKARGSDGHSGLGLAIVRALVEAHGGTIRAASEPGRGTEFAAMLPTRSAVGA